MYFIQKILLFLFIYNIYSYNKIVTTRYSLNDISYLDYLDNLNIIRKNKADRMFYYKKKDYSFFKQICYRNFINNTNHLEDILYYFT
jgi:hypothetical protein